MKPSELKDTFRKFFKHKASSMVVGPPGIGKTEIVKQVAAELEYDLIVMYPAISEPVDFRGMPTYNTESNEAKFVPFDVLNDLITADKPTICFMDDFGQANQSVQAACMHLFLERKVGDHDISDNITFVICTNDKKHNAAVTGIIEPVKSRMTSIINLESDVDDWIDWAIQKNLAPEVIGFIRLRGYELLSKFEATTSLTNTPSPRGTEFVSKIVEMKFSRDREAELITGAVGAGYATEFIGFKDLFDKLEDPMYIIQHPDKVEIDLSEPSIIYAYCSALSHIATPERMDAIVTFAKRLPIEYQIKLLQHDCRSADPENHAVAAYTDWAIENQDIQKAA